MEYGAQALPPTIPMGLHVGIPAPIRGKRALKHMVLVLQGHHQWALSSGLPHTKVMEAAAERLLELVEHCATRAIEKVTMCLFSDDLHRLPRGCNADLVRLFLRYAKAGANNMHRNDVNLTIEGFPSGLDSLTRVMLQDVARRTRLNSGLRLTVAVDSHRLSGRLRSVHAENLAFPGETGSAHSNEGGFGVEPDFVIRTGGPMPAHRAMLWDTQKTALFFTDVCWPDFDATNIQEALDWYDRQSRPVGIQLRTPPSPVKRQS